MASIFSHIAVPVGLGLALGRERAPLKLVLLGMAFSIAPDLDTIGFALGVPYESGWGHRGFTHSIAFALVASFATLPIARRLASDRATLFAFTFFSMLSHGLLDAMTTGGLGVAFFWPFDPRRFFFPLQVIEVSPIGLTRFFDRRGLAVLESEALTIWLPCLAIGLSVFTFRRMFESALRRG